jgi:hypothetical protein
MVMPGEWGKMSEFKQLLIVRVLRPDRITNALQNFCEKVMGSHYVNQVCVKLSERRVRWHTDPYRGERCSNIMLSNRSL